MLSGKELVVFFVLDNSFTYIALLLRYEFLETYTKSAMYIIRFIDPEILGQTLTKEHIILIVIVGLIFTKACLYVGAWLIVRSKNLRARIGIRIY